VSQRTAASSEQAGKQSHTDRRATEETHWASVLRW